MKRHWLTATLVAAVATGVAFAQETKKEGKKGSAKAVTVRMHAQNKSGESGTAKLTPQGADKTRVEISLKGAPKGTPQPAHIHEGSCAKLDPKPKYGLENVVDGKSSTVVPQGIDAVRGMAINVHKSADDIKTYVSCGDIGKAGGGAMKKGGGKMEKSGGKMEK
jgi:Cu/Zn superoxide dismutase